MSSAAPAANPNSRPVENTAPFEGGLPLRIGALLQERDALLEEVRQLRAAVQLYTEVVRRLRANGQPRVA
jgi:hypothetical protein